MVRPRWGLVFALRARVRALLDLLMASMDEECLIIHICVLWDTCENSEISASTIKAMTETSV